ncbi:MAG: MFS transporter [Crocinitomicaceae bacterium]|nr:MFS transporter [Crocinitomicaceae bacterium]
MITKGDKKIIRAWTFYDWANSVYPLVITTAIFPIFYETITGAGPLGIGKGPNSDLVTFFGAEIKNSVLYSFVVAASLLVVCILSPLLSGIADFSGSKKRFLQFFCLLGSVACGTLYFFNANHLELSMLSVFFASIGFYNSLVFYNAYLPDIAEPADHDRISARGFSMGYFGSAILLIACLVLLRVFEIIKPADCFWITGIWWLGFAQLTFLKLPAPSQKAKITGKILGNGFRELLKVGHFVRKTSRLKRFLVSFFLFSMGVQTLMLMAVLFAKKEIFKDGDTSGLIIAVLLIQFIAIPGALVFSKASSKFGNLTTLGIALVIWVFCCTFAYFFVYDTFNFYILASIVGFVMGGTQSLSRSTYSKFLPETEDTASFFSFYDITEKMGMVFGMVIFGYVEASSGDMRMSVLALITFFVMGFIALLFVPKLENKSFEETQKH